MRRLGIDPGTRRLGVAVADDDGPALAEVRAAIERRNDEQAARAIAAIARAEGAGEIVVGLPVGLDGREGPAARRARALAAAVEVASGLPVVLWDERMSSAAAHRALAASGHAARARRSRVDSVAAAIVLESYLDALRARAGRAARDGH